MSLPFLFGNNLIINANEIPPTVFISETEVDLDKNVGKKALRGIKGKDKKWTRDPRYHQLDVACTVLTLVKCALDAVACQLLFHCVFRLFAAVDFFQQSSGRTKAVWSSLTFNLTVQDLNTAEPCSLSSLCTRSLPIRFSSQRQNILSPCSVSLCVCLIKDCG